MTMRRTFLTAAVVALSAALTACGTANKPASGGSSGSNELTVWFPGNSQVEIDLVTKTLIPKFEQQTGSKVTVTYIDWPNISPKLTTAFASGTTPDVWGHGTAAASGFVANDRVLALDDRINAMPASDREDLKALLDMGVVDGKHYISPLSASGTLLVYRKDILQAAGVDPATLTSWESVYDAARKLKTGSRSGLQILTTPIADEQSFIALLTSDGGTMLSSDGKSATFNSPAGVDALSYMVKLYQGDGAVATGVGDDYLSRPPAQQPLALGTAAIAQLGPNQLLQLVAAKPDLAGKLGVLSPPSMGGHPGRAYGGVGTGLFISKDSKNQDLAWKFLQFMASPDVSNQYAQAIGSIPIRKSAASSDYVTKNPLLTTFLTAQPSYVANPNVPAWVQVRDVLSRYLQQALAGKTPPKEALDKAATEVKPLLEKS
ncbi:ABC transporter substrate-binding protein [Kribbella sp. NBC_00662]|uniref:ABC transporter substrate-binding protein n=1 Tax=Kribbella sp. NBC_00662 TaxID=2975969 RepID=UPI0032568331